MMHQLRGVGSLQSILGAEKTRSTQTLFDENKEVLRSKPSLREANKKNNISGRDDDTRCPKCDKSLSNKLSEVDRSNHFDQCLSNNTISKNNRQSELKFSRKGFTGVQPPPSDEQIVALHQATWGAIQENVDDGNIRKHQAEEHKAFISLSENEYSTKIVGRRYQPESQLKPGDLFEIVWERNNANDPNAVLAIDRNRGIAIGHLPRTVAQILGPLLRASKVVACGTVSENGVYPQNIQVVIKLDYVNKKCSVEEREVISGKLQDAIAENQSRIKPFANVEFLKMVEHMLQTVQQIENRALEPRDNLFICRFMNLQDSAKALFLRLSERSKLLFRISSIVQGNDTRKALSELENAQFIFNVQTKDLMERGEFHIEKFANLFTNAELYELLESLPRTNLGKNSRSLKKKQYICLLRDIIEHKGLYEEVNLTEKIESFVGEVMEIDFAYMQSFHKIQHLFFLDEKHSITHWMGVNAGQVKYPKYTINRKLSVFASPEMFHEYQESLYFARMLLRGIEQSNYKVIEESLKPVWKMLDEQENKYLCAEMPSDSMDQSCPDFFQHFNFKWIYTTMATVGVGILEKKKMYKIAIERLQQLLGGIFCNDRRGYWWIRLSTDLEHLKRPNDSLEIAETGLADHHLNDEDILTLRKRVLKLSKPPRRWTKPTWLKELREPPIVEIEARPLNNYRGERSRFYGYNDIICSVEELAIQHYALQYGFKGIHSESSIWTTLFSLIMFDAIFQPGIPDVFCTPFQTAPLDFGYASFYISRRTSIDSILEDVKNGGAARRVEMSWNENHGTMVRGINWNLLPLEELLEIVHCVSPTCIAAICRALAVNGSNWSSGMPDLLLWHPEASEAKLVEVKGPRDSLSDKQRVWLSYLEEAGMPVEVLKVHEPSRKKSKK